LYAALPRTTAAYLTLCNGRLTADECYRQAIVNKVVPREKLMATCEEMADGGLRSVARVLRASARSGGRRERGWRRRPARLPRETQAGVEDALSSTLVAEERAMALALKPLGKALGTEVVGMNVAEKLEPATLQWIERAFAEHPVLVFRSQRLDAAE